MSPFALRPYHPETNRAPRLHRSLVLVCLVYGASHTATPVWAHTSQTTEQSQQSEHGSLAEVGAKLANPVSEVWALFTEFDLDFSDGDLNSGDPKVGGRMIFQPVMPITMYALFSIAAVPDKYWKDLKPEDFA